MDTLTSYVQGATYTSPSAATVGQTEPLIPISYIRSVPFVFYPREADFTTLAFQYSTAF